MFGEITPRGLAITVCVLIVSLTIHEMTHAFVGHALGDETAADEGRITLNPLKHIDPFMTIILPIVTISLPPHIPVLAAKPVPFDMRNVKWGEFGAALIAFAGPLSNLVLAIIAGFVSHFIPITQLSAEIIATFIAANVSLFVFNLIPIPPLDGSRVLYAFAPDGLRRVMEQMEQYGLFIIFGLLIVTQGRFFGFVGTLVDMVLRILPFNPFIG